MTRWEYRVLRLTGDDAIPLGVNTVAQAALNQYGDEGWELVGFQLIGNPHPYLDQLYVFKRPIMDDGRQRR